MDFLLKSLKIIRFNDNDVHLKEKWFKGFWYWSLIILKSSKKHWILDISVLDVISSNFVFISKLKTVKESHNVKNYDLK